MKNDILHSGKLYSFERQHNYKCHIDKMNRIKKNKSSNLTISLRNQAFLPTYPSGYKIQQQFKVKQQNSRLIKRLGQIQKRKKFQVIAPQTQLTNLIKFNHIHKKYHEYERQQKQKEIQEENQKLVQKLLDRIRKNKSKEEYSRDQNDVYILRKSRSKKKLSGSQQKSRVKKSKDMQKNKSLLHDLSYEKLQNHQKQRKKNYSTLLPTIDKIYAKKDKSDSSHIKIYQVQSMLNKYGGSNKSDGKQDKSQTLEVKKKTEDDEYDIDFQQQGNDLLKKYEGVKAQQLDDHLNNKDLSTIKQPTDSNKNAIYVPKKQQAKTSRTKTHQQSNPQEQQKKTSINKKIEQKLDQRQNIMDPSLKFEKLKNKKSKGKKRQKIQKIKQENQYYEQQNFEDLDVDIKEKPQENQIKIDKKQEIQEEVPAQ